MEKDSNYNAQMDFVSHNIIHITVMNAFINCEINICVFLSSRAPIKASKLNTYLL